MTETLDIAVAPLGISGVCKALGQPKHRINYAIRSRGIAPDHQVSGVCLYSAATIEKIRSALIEIETAKQQRQDRCQTKEIAK